MGTCERIEGRGGSHALNLLSDLTLDAVQEHSAGTLDGHRKWGVVEKKGSHRQSPTVRLDGLLCFFLSALERWGRNGGGTVF